LHEQTAGRQNRQTDILKINEIKRSEMKRLLGFLWRYKEFSAAVLAAIVAGGLELGGMHTAAHWVLGVASLLALIPLASGMWQDFRHGQWGLDILALAAILSAVLLHQYWAAIVVVIMLTGGESLEDYAEHRAQSELRSLLEQAPQTAHVIKSGKVNDVAANAVNVGDKLVIKPGELVPVDALIIEGSSSFDESSLTGESLPQTRTVGQEIVSGSINQGDAVTVKALRTAAGSQYEQIIKLVRAAGHNPAPFVRLADRYSIPFTVLSFAIAGTVWALTGSALRFLEVIIVATPCPLLLAAPIALISGMSRASKYGIVIKTGSALEKLANLKTLAFDKTGTLTRGEPSVKNIRTYNKFTEADVLSAAASLEQTSNHILAKAIVEAAEGRKIAVSKAKHVSEASGYGLSAQVKGRHIQVGRLDYLQDNDVQMPPAFKATNVEGTATSVAIDGQLAGIITFIDEVRPEAKVTIERLRQAGIRDMLMVTGDNMAAAKLAAATLGIKELNANARPADKLTVIEQIRKRPVGFVGDGVNDAPVLTAADLGIALGARGSTAASESADVVILPDDLRYVAKSVVLAQRAFTIAKQSIFIGIGISIILMGLFATGKFPPVLGAVLQEVVDVVVIFNALRAHNISAD
jgi:heavy metal translocating P-type ATPase